MPKDFFARIICFKKIVPLLKRPGVFVILSFLTSVLKDVMTSVILEFSKGVKTHRQMPCCGLWNVFLQVLDEGQGIDGL